MKNLTLTYLLFILNSFVFGQGKFHSPVPPPPELMNEDSICSIYQRLAQNDFKNGEFNWISIGLNLGYLELENFDPKFDQFFENYLTSKHSLRTINLGCLSFPQQDCYNNTLDSLILDKLGRNFFDKELKTAKKLYSDWKKFKINSRDIFDWSKTYYVVDSPVKLNGNDKELEIYPIQLNAHSIELTVDTNGFVTDVSVLRISPLERVINKELKEELNKKFDWVPAYLYGRKVKSTFWIEIRNKY